MSSVERLEKLETQTSELEAPDHCVFCYKKDNFWYKLIQLAYQSKVGHKVEHTTPCIHNKDPWLLWTVEAANFIGGSFRDIAKDCHRNFVIEKIQDSKFMIKQIDTLYDKWNTHSPWIDIWSEDGKLRSAGKNQKYNTIQQIDNAAEKEQEKIIQLRTIEWKKAKECLQYFK